MVKYGTFGTVMQNTVFPLKNNKSYHNIHDLPVVVKLLLNPGDHVLGSVCARARLLQLILHTAGPISRKYFWAHI